MGKELPAAKDAQFIERQSSMKDNISYKENRINFQDKSIENMLFRGHKWHL